MVTVAESMPAMTSLRAAAAAACLVESKGSNPDPSRRSSAFTQQTVRLPWLALVQGALAVEC